MMRGWFGFFPARLGMQLHGSRYWIMRKLGRGQFSSTWLAYDSQSGEAPEYHVIKILTAYATECHHDGHLLELKVMQTIDKVSERYNLPRLEDHFEIDMTSCSPLDQRGTFEEGRRSKRFAHSRTYPWG